VAGGEREVAQTLTDVPTTADVDGDERERYIDKRCHWQLSLSWRFSNYKRTPQGISQGASGTARGPFLPARVPSSPWSSSSSPLPLVIPMPPATN